MEIDIPSEYTAKTMLSKAILFYSGGFDFCTVHEIKNNEIQPGKALEISELEMLFKSGVTRNNREQKWSIPANLIDFGPGIMTWFCKSKVAPIFWDVKDKRLNKFNAVEILWPNMIFRADKRGLSVWAVKATSNPRQKAKLYKAPFFNVYDNGIICLGSAPNHDPNPENIAKIENAFFNSSFSHGLDNIAKRIKYRGGHNSFWKKYCAECKKKMPQRFPNEILIPAEQRI